MTDPYFAANSDELKQKFPQFYDIAKTTNTLLGYLNEIDADNKKAAGGNDPIAKQYLEQVDPVTQSLSDLVNAIEKMFGITGDSGIRTATNFDNTEQHNKILAQGL